MLSQAQQAGTRYSGLEGGGGHLPPMTPPGSATGSHLEYTCPVWAPYTCKDTELLESVQRFACKMVTHCWSSSYEELLALTNLPTLEKRRLHLKLSHLYKIVHHQSFFPDEIVLFREHLQYNSQSVHALTLQQPIAHTHSYYHSFVSHTISVWNTLPYEVTSSS